MTDTPAVHYDRVAATYDDLWSYDPDYVPRFSRAIADTLRLTRSDAVADVGCGTGLFTRHLAADLEPARPVLCVDPAEAMLERLPASPHLRAVHAGAEDLASGRVALPDGVPLDALVLKESIHHVTDRARTLGGLVGLLSRRGRILVVLLPRVIGHPLFREAHERFRERQPAPEQVEADLAAAGLSTSLSHRTFHVVIERERYIHMLESRYLSVLGEFSESELQAGIDQFRHAYRDPVLRFDDHFAFVRGWHPPDRH